MIFLKKFRIMYVREMREIAVPELDKYIIIDTHGGAEDILAIAIALKLAQRYDKIVLGITCVNGRRTLDQAVHDALIAQQIAGTSVPVYRGSKQSVMLRSNYPDCHHMVDYSHELDSLPVSTELQALIQKESAPVFISQQIKKHAEQLCVITLGPLTNLALAYHRTQGTKVLSSVRINGGAYTGVGNVMGSSGSEGNFHYDPQAAHIVIINYTNIYINPIEKSLETSWESYFRELLQENESKSNPLLSTILQLHLKKKLVLCGPLLTIMPAFQRHTVQKVLNVYSELMTNGNNIVGLLAPNWLRLEVAEHDQAPNTKIYSVFDLPQIEKMIKLAMFQ